MNEQRQHTDDILSAQAAHGEGGARAANTSSARTAFGEGGAQPTSTPGAQAALGEDETQAAGTPSDRASLGGDEVQTAGESNEVGTTYTKARTLRNKRWRATAALGVIVALIAVFAMMMPAISMTKNAATDSVGIEFQQDAASQSASAASADSSEAAISIEPDAKADEPATDATGTPPPAGESNADTQTNEPADSTDAQGDDADTDENASSSSDASEPTGSEGADTSGSSASAEPASSDSAASADKSDSASSASAAKPDMPEQEFKDELRDKHDNVILTVSVKAPEGAFPAGTTMQIKEIDTNKIADQVEAAIKDDPSVSGTVKSMTAVDIRFIDPDGKEIEPAKNVEVRITSDTVREIAEPVLVHVVDKTKESAKDKESEAEVVKKVDVVDENTTEDTLEFKTNEFSPYVIVEMETITTQVITAGGETYSIVVSYGPEAGIPNDAELVAREILPNENGYDDYLAQVDEQLGGETSYARFFDIFIMSEGFKIQPAAKVNVEITLSDAGALSDEVQTIHFADDGPESLKTTLQGETVSFNTEGFSVYAIVDAPEPATTEVTGVATLNELANNTDTPFYLAVQKDWFFKNTLNGKSALLISKGDALAASTWYFENAAAGNSYTYFIYTYTNDGKRYLRNGSDNLMELVDRDGTVFEASQAGTGLFYLKKLGEKKWLQYSNSGNGIRFYTDNNNAANSQIAITYASSYELPKDPYGLDGATYGIAYHNDTAAAAALMAEQKDEKHLAAEDMLMRPDVIDNDGILLVAEDSTVTDWTFEVVDQDWYRIWTAVDGKAMYLTLDKQTATLTEEPDDETSLFKVTPGTGDYAGKYCFSTANGYKLELNLSGNDTSKGFWGTTGNNGAFWMNLVLKTPELNDDDFVRYSAKKASVSSTDDVFDTQQVVIYTRVWNDSTKKYEFYAVDHDGSLIRCYDVGDAIEWVGYKANTALWNFTEYRDSDGAPNYYYELQNTQYGNYIAPQVTGGQTMSDRTIGVNLNGRRYGQNYTTIIAWDNANYAYAGLKVENGHVVACPLSEAQDFYFAVIHPKDATDQLTTVDTIDSTQYGITMKMIDFNNEVVNKRDSVQNGFFGGDNNTAGLLSTDLKDGATGYPSTTSKTGAEQPLSNLFNNMTPVNHLFLQSIYNESGYFEYDSTQNFAHLDGDAFTVYDQLGAITGKDEHKNTREHGQFMPYNKIEAGKYAYDKSGNVITNQTDVSANELPDLNARKGEKLYLLGSEDTVDYFFGMEMDASFSQTASGLDAWGHDIVFEFSGDDDFWLYVDGELVLDLGGVHSAMVGTVNFRTGVITSSRGNSTLYDTFKKNYQTRGLSDAEIDAKLAEIFTTNEAGQHVFKDFTNHTMRMFYMERGAGASNLHMRFNLAAVKPGTFLLSKKLSGTDSPANDLIEFPYQIRYRTQDDGESADHLLSDPESVVYQETSNTVRYAESYTPAGGTEAYDNVFFLKPGETAEVTLPEGATTYYVTECGVNPNVYDEVKANGTKLNGTNGDTKTNNEVNGVFRHDYSVEPAGLERSEVGFDNHVREGAMRTLSITKKLYDTDGVKELQYQDDGTLFSFRLNLGNEGTDADSIPAANLYPYLVKSPGGHYCSWNADNQSFAELEYTDYAALSEYLATLSSAQQETIVFRTSPNGSISNIPTGYTVEVRDLIVDSLFRVEERTSEIPKGYTLRESDGYQRTDAGHESNYKTTPVSDTIVVDDDPAILVSNQKGWGLTVQKAWSDADFMKSHDPVYFAVYRKSTAQDATLAYELVDDTVRQLPSEESSIYYFFYNLSNVTFSNYEPFEVKLTGDFQVDDEGKVTGYDSIEQLLEGSTTEVAGTPAGSDEAATFTYKVSYARGESTGHNENIRTDTVTNSRPGIKLMKTDWDGGALAGAKFTLKDANGNDVALESYTSQVGGLITTAYLPAGTYTLSEIATPTGFVGMGAPMSITVGADNRIEDISGVDGQFYTYENAGDAGAGSAGADADMAATVTIRNRPGALLVKKVDALTGEALEGVKFNLYLQITDKDGNKVKGLQPLAGYRDMSTDENGILSSINMELAPGTYYLTETQSAAGYDRLKEDVCFTIGDDGSVSIETEAYRSWLTAESGEGGSVSYTLTIPNGKVEIVKVKKVAAGSSDMVLKGARFALYRASDWDDDARQPKTPEGAAEPAAPLTEDVTDANGTLPLGYLSTGSYRLVELEAPEGYNLMDSAVAIEVDTLAERPVTAMQGNGQCPVAENDGAWEIEVWNTAGRELPNTGGPGTVAFTVLGVALLLVGLTILARGRKA